MNYCEPASPSVLRGLKNSLPLSISVKMFWENRRLVVIFLKSRPTKEAAMQVLITQKMGTNVFLNLNSFVGGISGAHLVCITGKGVTQVGNTLKAGQ